MSNTQTINIDNIIAANDLDELKVSELRALLVLSMLKPGKWAPLNELRGDTGKTSSFSRSVTKLVSNNWISTCKDPHDSRSKLVRLTVKGRNKLKKQLKPELIEYHENHPISEIPYTTKRRYLTGLAALNLPSDEGTGDWHFIETFKGSHGRSPGPFFVAGDNYVDTYSVFGSEGIEDQTKNLEEAGVISHKKIFAANHYRAMADMIFQRLYDGNGIDSYVADDWFPEGESKRKLAVMLDKLEPVLRKEQMKDLRVWRSKNDLAAA
ncbi:MULTISPECIES: MarR family winged helix-turn-helix transcriptional regulator [unclassified Neptuniibacter]|uniref:MarR family winged helix-turn-helix transcriptional regulator n=1 Tax=unclassified Neptuniibacter TaxID=2630693 RepID=UPI000C540A74|nr:MULTISPECIES: MarR family winged helix-turn-helix transcriptional regulator [unclassified Neptuniibacter]MAY42513.1 hypothetical protein [Oceanospirillaceae bacterium]